MPQPFRNQKRQTRLQFSMSPIAPDAKDKYSVAVQDRLANVRYEGARLSQPKAVVGDDAGHIFSPDLVPTSHKKLSPPSSSPPVSPSLPAQATPDSKDQLSTEDDEDDMPIPSSKRRKLAARMEKSTIDSSPRRSTRLNQSSPLQKVVSRKQIVRSTRSEPRSSPAETLAQVNDLRPDPGSKLSDLGSAESSDEGGDVLVSQPTLRRRNHPHKYRDNDFVVPDEHGASDVSREVDKPARSQPRPRPRQKQRSTMKQPHAIENFIADDDEVEFVTSGEDVEPGPHSASTRRASTKSLQRRARREREELDEDLLDLQDSDQDAIPTSRTRGGPVTTQRDRMKEHLELLKKKRARKHQARVVESDEDELDVASMPSDDNGIDIDHIAHEPDEVDLLLSNDSPLPLLGAPDTHSHTFDSDQAEANVDDDFVVEDDEAVASNRHGRPHPDIPLQFTSYASAKPRDLFVHIVEWMVKNKISPAFARNDDLFDLSFSRIDDQVKAQAGSRLISAAWGVTFKRAILARPIMTVEALPGLDEDHVRTCDACNRTNHPARYDFRFSGNPYHKDTLEPLELEKDASSDGGNDDDNNQADENSESEGRHTPSDTGSNHSYNSQGHILPRQSTHFYLGRYCAAAAEMGHKLTHWKHHLNTDVLSYLSDQGVLNAQEIVRRDRQSHRRREKEAENIVDAMEDTGVIRELWERFQADLDAARWGMEGHEGGGGGGGSSGQHTKMGRGKSRIGSTRVSGADGRIGEWMDSGNSKGKRRDRGDGHDSDSDSE